MSFDMVNTVLPVLGRPLEADFNVLDVMHHGLHEKQISNIFRWLLEAEGSHGLGDRFVRIFIDAVNRDRADQEPIPHGVWWVHQEVNTSHPGETADIADIVLESDRAVIVVENYFTSDGHGHDYNRYLRYSCRDGRMGVVALLCRDTDRTLQTLGWEHAPVLTYQVLLERLMDEIHTDHRYQRTHPEAHSFIEQVRKKFSKGQARMNDPDLLGFVKAMCQTGEARRYQDQRADMAAESFATDLAEQARHRFGESRELLQRIKRRLKNYSEDVLADQLNDAFEFRVVSAVSARYAGIYQWTVNFDLADIAVETGLSRLQLKFGPSAWFANEQDPHWESRVETAVADYSRLFLTGNGTVRQSGVSLQNVLDGIDPADVRLRDEIVTMVRETFTS